MSFVASTTYTAEDLRDLRQHYGYRGRDNDHAVGAFMIERGITLLDVRRPRSDQDTKPGSATASKETRWPTREEVRERILDGIRRGNRLTKGPK